MKKIIVCFLTTVVLLTSACSSTKEIKPENQSESTTEIAAEDEGTMGASSSGNFTDEMKMTHAVDISPEDGADSTERQGDHQDSPYFVKLDFYNMESTSSLTILPKFKTLQQTSEWSCGVTAATMVINYYDMLGEYDEKKLAEFRSNGLTPEATTLRQAMEIFEGVGGFELETTLDYGDNLYEEFTLETIQGYLKKDIPVMVAWNDWGGHWQVIIGYDTLGTESTQDDVIIVADSYDSTDHNQDGYGVYGAERFFDNFTMYDFFSEEEGNDMLFIAAKPATK